MKKKVLALLYIPIIGFLLANSEGGFAQQIKDGVLGLPLRKYLGLGLIILSVLLQMVKVNFENRKALRTV